MESIYIPWHRITLEKEYQTKLPDYRKTDATLSILYFGNNVFRVTCDVNVWARKMSRFPRRVSPWSAEILLDITYLSGCWVVTSQGSRARRMSSQCTWYMLGTTCIGTTCRLAIDLAYTEIVNGPLAQVWQHNPVGQENDGLVQGRCNSSASAMELRFSCTNSSRWSVQCIEAKTKWLAVCWQHFHFLKMKLKFY